MGITQRKRITRATSTNTTIKIKLAKPRNSVLQAAALGQVKLGTAKHEKSKGAQRRAEKMALQKTAKTQAES
jgi:hypothetical protein